MNELRMDRDITVGSRSGNGSRSITKPNPSFSATLKVRSRPVGHAQTLYPGFQHTLAPALPQTNMNQAIDPHLILSSQ